MRTRRDFSMNEIVNIRTLKFKEHFKNNFLFILLILAIICYIITFSYITILRHWTYYSAYLDLGWFEQALWSTIEGHFLYVSYLDSSHFGTHNSPILFFLIPIYHILPYSETLLITQTILLAIAAIPLFYIGKLLLDKWGGLIFSFCYLLYPGLHGLNLFDFHELAFLPLILFSTILCLFTKRFNLFVILSLLAMLVKEDVSILLFTLTFYAIYFKSFEKKHEIRILYGLLIIYIGWLILSLLFIIPYFNVDGYFHSSRYELSYGIFCLLFHNFHLKVIYLVLLFLPLIFTPLAAPEFLIISFPSFAEILLQWPVAYRITTQYSALVIPVIFVSSMIGIKKIQSRLSNIRSSNKVLYSIILISSLLSCLLCTPAPVSPFTLYYKFSPNNCNYVIDDHVQNIDQAIKMIPPDSSVSTQNNLAGHLSQRMDIFIKYRENSQYIFLDNKTKNMEWLNSPMGELPLEKYELIFHVDEIQLYKLKEKSTNN